MSALKRAGLILIAVLLGTDSGLACSVCYGAADSPIIAGMNLSVLFMAILTYSILVGFASFFLYLRRREKMFRGEMEPGE